MQSVTAIGLSLTLLALAGPAAAGELSSKDVRKVMAEHGDEVKACYLRHGFRQRSATGRVTVAIIVEEDGSTRDVRVDAPGVKGKRLARCVNEAATAWQFPVIDAPTEVQLPFLFQHTRGR